MRFHHAILGLIVATPLAALAAPPKAGTAGGRNVEGGTPVAIQMGTAKTGAAGAAKATTGLSTQLPLPAEIRIGKVTDNFSGTGRIDFPYDIRGGGKTGPVRIELALRSDGRRNGLLDVQENVQLLRRGVFRFKFDVSTLGEVRCSRPCFLLLTVRRDTEYRQVQMPLIATKFFMRSGGPTRSRGSKGPLDDYALRFSDPQQGDATLNPSAGDQISAVRVSVRRRKGKETRVRDVRAELLFVDRSGRRVIDSIDRVSLGGRENLTFRPRGFVLPENDGSFEFRLMKGRSEVFASADWVPTVWRIGPASQVRDKR